MPRLSKLAIVVPLVGTIFWWLHAVLNRLFPPFEHPADYALWILGSVCKMGTLLLLLLHVLPTALEQCYANVKVTTRAFATWSISGLVLLGAVSIAREPLTTFFKHQSTLRFYYAHEPRAVLGERDEPGQAEFLPRWRTGKIIVEEAVTILLACAVLAAAGFLAGEHPRAASFAGSMCCLVVQVGGCYVFHFTTWDYDTFFSSTLVAPLTLDLVLPFMACDPTSEFGFPLFLIFTMVCMFVVRRSGTDSPIRDIQTLC
jgi:hypothetical protein